MRSEIFTLPLLALGRGVLASPCVPYSSSSLTLSTTATSSTASTESTTVLATTTASESTATLSTASTESSSESTTASASESTTATSSLSIASTESTTLFTSASTTSSAVQSTTTTTAAPEPQEPNLLTNPGFEDSSVEPWKLFRPTINQGQISIARDQFYEGSQSGHYQYSANPNDAFWGVYQSVDGSRLVADDPYQITLRIRVAPGTCPNVYVGGSSSNNGRITTGMVTVDVAAASVDWIQVTTVVRYNGAVLNAGPGLAIMSTCHDVVSFWVDDVALRKYVESVSQP